MRLVTPVLSAAVCKSSRIRHSPNSGTVRRFPVLPTPCAKTAKSYAFCDSLPVSASVCVFAFDTGVLVLWLEAFGRSRLYRCQSTPGPPMPCFVAQSFAFAVFATLICQINSVFPCKDTKAQEFGLCRILGIVMPVFCGTELRFGSLCNLGLSKKLRFSLQRHKTAESGLYRIPGQAAVFMHRA